MTDCVTHHICKCQAEKIKQLEDAVAKYEATTRIRKGYDELVKMKAELTREVESCQKALGEAGLLLSPFVDSRDW